MTKLNFHLKSFSFSSSPSPVDADSSESKKVQRTPKKYLANLRDNRFFSLRRNDGQKEPQAKRIAPPNSLPARGLTPPKTPQIASLFSTWPISSESIRHHRQHTVSLSHIPNMAKLMNDRSASIDLESQSEITRLRRLNPRQQRNPSTPTSLVPVSSGGALGADVILQEQLKYYSVSQTGTTVRYSASQMGTPIPSFVLQTPTSDTSEYQEYNSSVDSTLAILESGENMKNKDKPPIRNKITGLHRSVEILQEVTKRIKADQELSQRSLFMFSLCPAFFVASVAMLAFIPHDIWNERVFGIDNLLSIPFIVFSIVAALLHWGLWVMAVLFQSFCEMDLDSLFRRNGIVDQNGMRVGEADIITGVFG